MNREKTYYIIEDSNTKHNLPAGLRIIKSSSDILVSFEDDNVEGPFNNLKELKQQSFRYKELLKNNQKRAIKICKEKYIEEIAQIVFYPEDRNVEFQNQIERILDHSTNGNIKSKHVFGIHLFDKDKHKVIEIINSTNSLGVWEARIEVLNKNNKWIEKEKATTFFPENWTLQNLIEECEPAFLQKIKISENAYCGFTKSGIPVKFIFDSNANLKTIYPLFK